MESIIQFFSHCYFVYTYFSYWSSHSSYGRGIYSSHILACLCPAQMEGGEFREAIPSPGLWILSSSRRSQVSLWPFFILFAKSWNMSSLPQSLRYVSLIAKLVLSIFFVKKYVNVRNRNVPLGHTRASLAQRDTRYFYSHTKSRNLWSIYYLQR